MSERSGPAGSGPAGRRNSEEGGRLTERPGPEPSGSEGSPWVRVSAGLARVEAALAGLLVAAIVAVVLAQVVCRRVLGRPLVWSEELCTYAFMAAAMLGASAATQRRTHVRLSLLLDRLPRRRGLERALELLLALVFAGLLPGTVTFLLAVHRLGLRSPALGIPMTWVYGLVPLALALWVLHLAVPREAGTETGPTGEAGP